jgi:hypothetical protein
MDGADALASFKAVTEASDETAHFYLAATDGDVQRAVDMFFAGTCPSDAPFPKHPGR